jgi:hypothetical protein
LGKVCLIADQDQDDIFVAVGFDIFDPSDAIPEALPPRDIKHNQCCS